MGTATYPSPVSFPTSFGACAVAAGLLLTGCASASNSSPDAAQDLTRGQAAERGGDRVDGWRTTTPAEAGFRGKRLDALAREAKELDSSCYAVVRGGRLVRDWNWKATRTQPREVYSVTKSIASALVGIAVRDGDLSPDDRVSTYVKAWRGTDSADVTVRHLLANDSGRFWSLQSDYITMGQKPNRTKYAVGLSQQYAVGSAWAYNNAAIQVLDRVLRKATGEATDEFARTRLFEPLGMRHTSMTPDASGRSTNVYFGAQTTCLDLARFGRLYLQQGKVGGERIVSRAWVRRSVGSPATTHNAAYGYLWWLNREGSIRGATDPLDDDGQPTQPREGQLAPDAPADVYAAIGLGGQVTFVDPGSRTVVVRLGGAGGQSDQTFGLATASRAVTWALKD